MLYIPVPCHKLVIKVYVLSGSCFDSESVRYLFLLIRFYESCRERICCQPCACIISVRFDVMYGNTIAFSFECPPFRRLPTTAPSSLNLSKTNAQPLEKNFASTLYWTQDSIRHRQTPNQCSLQLLAQHFRSLECIWSWSIARLNPNYAENRSRWPSVHRQINKLGSRRRHTRAPIILGEAERNVVRCILRRDE